MENNLSEITIYGNKLGYDGKIVVCHYIQEYQYIKHFLRGYINGKLNILENEPDDRKIKA